MDHKSYYEAILSLPIEQIAADIMPGRLTEKSGNTLYYNCPNHASGSKKSLNIYPGQNRFTCWGCHISGDVIHLVEFVHTGNITTGKKGSMPESHKAARDYLAERAGLPPMSSWGLSKEEIEKKENAYYEEQRIKDVLTNLSNYYHCRLLSMPDVLQWFKDKWGLSDEILKSHLIGYSDNQGKPSPAEYLYSCGFTPHELCRSGAFTPSQNDEAIPFFSNRIIFPYWKQGKASYLIARQTPWTPQKAWEAGKYKKLPVHNESNNSLIHPCVNNSTLFNEDILNSNPDYVIVTEGVTDCLSLIEKGFPAISPVTIQIKLDDWHRIIQKLRNTKTVYICQDNEISEAGFKASCKAWTIMRDKGIKALIARLPLSSKQIEARAIIKEKNLTNADRKNKEYEHIIEDAKIDVNQFFREGGTSEDFNNILSGAITPIDLSIEDAADMPESERKEKLFLILEQVAKLPAIEQEEYAGKISSRFGIKKAPVKQQIRDYQKRHKTEQKFESIKADKITAPAGSCRALIETAIVEAEEQIMLSKSSPGCAKHPYQGAAEAAYKWFVDNGAKFYNHCGEPFLYFNRRIFYVDCLSKSRKREWLAFMQSLTGISSVTAAGKIFYDAFANFAVGGSMTRKELSWQWTDQKNHIIYFNLNNANNEIIRISPDGIDILNNGGNAESIVLLPSGKIQDITYLPEADETEADTLLQKLISDNFTCSADEALIIRLWFCCFLLLDYAQTKPVMRFEGGQASGKSSASEFISYLVYGKDWKKDPTTASNYVDATQNPIMLIDNIETANMTPDFIKFLLLSSTGIAREKRAQNSDTGLVTERVNCLVNTTGIEPLGASLNEILSRTIICNFDLSNAKPGFVKYEIFQAIKENRNLLLSGLFKRTSRVLRQISEGCLKKTIAQIETKMGRHSKSRLNEYLGLMLLYLNVDEPENESEEFFRALKFTSESSKQIAYQTNIIASALLALFQNWEKACQLDDHPTSFNSEREMKINFQSKYPLNFTDDGINYCTGNELYSVLRSFCKDRNLEFPYKSTMQFIKRLHNDEEAIKTNGILIDKQFGRARICKYQIRFEKDNQDNQFFMGTDISQFIKNIEGDLI